MCSDVPRTNKTDQIGVSQINSLKAVEADANPTPGASTLRRGQQLIHVVEGNDRRRMRVAVAFSLYEFEEERISVKAVVVTLSI
jgi:hypothetical protein